MPRNRSRGTQGKKAAVPAGAKRGRDTSAAAASPILELQRTVGNRAVAALMRSGRPEREVEVSRPGDALEQEAERAVERVLSSSPKELREEELASPGRRPAAPPATASEGLGPELGPGRPLGPESRAFLEPRFGRDLEHVRVHTGPQAEESADAVQAKAFTFGRDVVFGAGEYAPGTTEGTRLLAHEMAHVVQQSAAGSPPVLQRSPVDGEPPPQSPAPPAQLQTISLIVVDLGASELITQQNPKLERFAKTVLESLLLFPEGTVQVTGHWDSSTTGTGGIQHSDAGQRAEQAKSALAALRIPPARIVTGTFDSQLLSKPQATPGGVVRIAFQPKKAELPKLALLKPVQPPSWLKPGLPGLLNLPRPSATPGSSPGGPGQESEPHEGTLGDLAKAFLTLPPVKKAVNDFLKTQKEEFKDLPTVDKAAVVQGAVTIGGGVAAGIASDPEARKKALDLLHGTEVRLPRIPGVPGRFSVQIFTKEELPKSDPHDPSPPKLEKPVGPGALLKFKLEF